MPLASWGCARNLPPFRRELRGSLGAYRVLVMRILSKTADGELIDQWQVQGLALSGRHSECSIRQEEMQMTRQFEGGVPTWDGGVAACEGGVGV